VGLRVGGSYAEAARLCRAQTTDEDPWATCTRLPEPAASLPPGIYFEGSPIPCAEDPAWCERCAEWPGACGATLRIQRCAGNSDALCAVQIDVALRPGASLGERFLALREAL